MRAPGLTPEGITSRTAPRLAVVAGVALLVLVSSATAAPNHQPAAEAAPTAAVAVQDLLVARAARAASPPASRRIAAQPVARLTPAQRRAAINNARRAAVIRFARAQKGKLYQHGAVGLRRYDCSGLTLRSFRQAGLRMPHSSRAQRTWGIRVSPRYARPGDLVSYNGHVGVFVGNWTMIDAPGRGRKVVERRIWRGQGLQFRRVIR